MNQYRVKRFQKLWLLLNHEYRINFLIKYFNILIMKVEIDVDEDFFRNLTNYK